MTNLDGVYYGQGLPPLADGDFGLTAGTVAAVISDIYDEQVGYGDLHPGLYAETKRIFDEAVDTGVESAVAGGADMPSDGFMGRLHDNAGVFAAFRTHAMQRDMVRLLTDNTGRLKSFAAFRKDAEQYASHRNRAWLKTEYDTAVNRAHFAARWRQFEQEKDVLPNLEWLPSTSPNPGADHRAFWGTVRPVGDAFWNEHRPGDRWNCKCELAATDKPATKVPYDGDPKNRPAKGLKANPGKKGEIFDKEHSYYPASCSACPFAKNRLLALVSDLAGRQNCESCKALRKATAEAEGATPDIASELGKLRDLKGSDYNKQLEKICGMNVFKKMEGKKGIYWTGNRQDADFENLLKAAEKSESLGNKVYILPNPGSVRTPDFIFLRKGIYKDYDLKTITGKNSAGNRMMESIGQTRRVLLNMATDYNPRNLAKEIKSYFEVNEDALEVRIYKGKRQIPITRNDVGANDFFYQFMRIWGAKK